MLKKRNIVAVLRKRRASQHRVRYRDRWRNYLNQHQQVAKDSWLRLLQTPVVSAVTWLLIGMAIALPMMLFAGLSMAERVSGHWGDSGSIALFLNTKATERQGRLLADQLAQRDTIDFTDYRPPYQVLAEFQALAGYHDVLEYLDTNPLPAVIVVHPLQHLHADAVADLLAELTLLSDVEQAVLDVQWVKRLHHMVVLGERVTYLIGVLLLLGILLVISHTVRSMVDQRRDEIVIVKLLGATNGFVRRPLLYTGLWYGLGGGLIAWLIILLSACWLRGPMVALTGLYDSDFQWFTMGFSDTLLLWCLAAALGVLGAWLAVGRYLRIEN